VQHGLRQLEARRKGAPTSQPGAVGPQQSENDAVWHLQVDVIDGCQFPESLRQAVSVNRVAHGRCFSSDICIAAHLAHNACKLRGAL
jgi:hypothetical protein